jgi:hypothetical protein
MIITAAVLACASSSAAQAAVTISSAATDNMACSAGVCAPTAADAVLNVGDLENLLASGNVKVTTTGSGVQATNIEIETALAWSNASTLTLDSFKKIRVEQPVTVSGKGSLSVTFDDGGSGGYFGFGWKGYVTFANLSSALAINGVSYTLVGDIKSLASAVAANPAGAYALANSHDAKKDGTYSNSPVTTTFMGIFEGLGNSVSNLSIDDPNPSDMVGLFTWLASGSSGGEIDNIRLENFSFSGNAWSIGGIVGLNVGIINGSTVSGTITSEYPKGSQIGLVASGNYGTIIRSQAKGSIPLNQASSAACVAGGDGGGLIVQSFGDCEVSVSSNYLSYLGGLTADNVQGEISQSYAEGTLTRSGYEGGLVGEDGNRKGKITQSYSTMLLKGGRHGDRYAGGFIGVSYASGKSYSYCYWDIDTSKTDRAVGNKKRPPGISGLTTEELQSGLPDGFDPNVWAEDAKINNGLPYLIDNPPEK